MIVKVFLAALIRRFLVLFPKACYDNGNVKSEDDSQ